MDIPEDIMLKILVPEKIIMSDVPMAVDAQNFNTSLSLLSKPIDQLDPLGTVNVKKGSR